MLLCPWKTCTLIFVQVGTRIEKLINLETSQKEGEMKEQRSSRNFLNRYTTLFSGLSSMYSRGSTK